MSDLAIGLVAEGTTDVIVIRAALNAILDRNYTLTAIQPEEPLGCFGGGWGGVYRWCRQVAKLGGTYLAGSTTLSHYDLIIIHLDADVGSLSYASANITDNDFDDLPCKTNWPPIYDTVDNLYKAVTRWLSPLLLNDKVIICIPSLCTESWVVAALYGRNDTNITTNVELNEYILNYLLSRPARERLVKQSTGALKKIPLRYKQAEHIFSQEWQGIEASCSQARDFKNSLMLAINNL